MPLYVPEQPGAPLSVLTLGVVGDEPPSHGLQHATLRDGIHLRWAFQRRYDPETGQPLGAGFPDNPGFPWFGFYLFRRLSLTAGAPTDCSAVRLRALGLPPGPLPAPTLGLTGFGTFVSDLNLSLTENFAPGDAREIDLEGRSFVRLELDPLEPCRRIDVTVGFMADVGQSGGTPGGRRPGAHGSDCLCGACRQSLRPILERVVSLGSGSYRATFGYDNSSGKAAPEPVGPGNRFHPDPADRGQPRLFRTGRIADAFSVDFDGRAIAWTLQGKTVTASASDAGDPTSRDGIVVTAFRAGSPVARKVLAGRTGETVTIPVIFEAMDAISVSGGPARLVDVCLARAGVADARVGWAPVPGCEEPLCLPVFHPNYPCNQGPINEPQAWEIARRRIKFGTEAEWAGAPFAELHTTLVEIVQGGVQFITDFFQDADGVPDEEAPGEVQPRQAHQSSLDLLLLASVDPAVAQMLGLYFVDESAAEGVLYDYLLVGDYNGGGQGNVANILARVAAGDFASLQAYLRAGVVKAKAPALAPPAGINGYAIPLSAVPFGHSPDAVGSVGLRWTIPEREGDRLASEAPVLYHLWRAVLPGEPFERPNPSVYSLALTQPIAVGATRTEDPAQPLPGWPPFSLFAIDDFLPEGWYSHALSAIDLFGRHSEVGAPGNWLDFNAPDPPLNDFAVNVLDKSAPPAPTEVRAWALDAGDPLVIADDAHNLWRAGVGAQIVGLRVRWVWTGRHMRQAPDTREFRIYLDPGSSKQSAADPAGWTNRLIVSPVAENVLDDGFQAAEIAPDELFEGDAATVNGTDITLDGALPLEDLALDGTEIELAGATGRKRFTILAIDVPNRRLTVDGTPAVSGTSAWAIGMTVRTYELFYPPAGGASIPLAPTDVEPVVYGVVGVSAADDKTHAPDRMGVQGITGRFGNEGAVGGPAGIFRVLRQTPVPLAPVELGDELLATRADFYSRSFFTLHWQKQQPPPGNLSAHVYRALDETLFATDALQPFPRTFSAGDLAKAFPPTWTQSQKDLVHTELTQKLTTPGGYASLTNNALRVIAGLPTNDAAYTRLTSRALPPETPDEVGPSDVNYTPTQDRGAYRDTLDGRANNRYFYRVSYVNRANTEGSLGVATPPVRLPRAVLPEPPVIVDAGAADAGKVRLSWRSSLDPDLVEYHVHRAEEDALARRLSADTLIATVAETRPPAERPVLVAKSDISASGGKPLFYVVAAVVRTGPDPAPRLTSPPSRSVSITTFEEIHPDPPQWLAPTVLPGNQLRLRWSVLDPAFRFLVQRKLPNASEWGDVSGWLAAGTAEFVDTSRGSSSQYDYRLIVIDNEGRQNDEFSTVRA